MPEHALVRTTCLPAFRLRPAADAYAALGQRLVEIHLDLEGVRARAEDELYALVATADTAFRQRVLLPIRRDVHNRREPSPALIAAARELDAPALHRWLALREQAAAAEVELAGSRAAAIEASRAELAERCASESFRRAVALTSPELLQAVRRAADPAAPRDRRWAKSESTVLRHVVRAIVKTTPLSWLAEVGWTSWPGAAHEADVPRIVRARTHPDLVRLTAVVAATVADLAPAQRPLQVAPGSYRRGDRWVFRRPALASGDPAAGTTTRRDELVELPLTAPLHAVVRTVGDLPRGTATAGAVTASLATRFGERTPAEIAGYLDQLVRAGVLVADDVIDPQSDTPLEDAARWASAAGHASTAAGLSHLADVTAAWAVTSSGDRPAALAELTGAWAGVLPGAPVGGSPVYEDVIAARPGSCDPPPGLDDLATLTPLLEVFDWFSVVRRAQRRRFVDAFGVGGRCGSVAEYALLYNRLWQDPNLLADPGVRDDPAVAELSALRARLATMIEHRPEQDEVVLPDDLVEAARAVPSALTTRPASWSVFAQPTASGGLCVNHVYGGWGRFTSRFLSGLPAEATADVRRTVLAGLGPAARAVQIRPVQGFAANRHPLIVDDEIGERAGQGTIALDRIDVAHDERTDDIRLYERGDDRPLDVLYLGFLVPLALPAHLTPLVNDLGSGLVDVAPLRPARRIDSVIGPLTVLPRVRYRRTVLARRSWLLSAAQVGLMEERLRSGATTAERLVAELRADCGWPRHVFIGAATDPDADPATDPDADAMPGVGAFVAWMGRLRSQYVDLGDALHLHHLRRILARYADGLRVEEALPEPVPGRRATEFVFETYRAARGD